MVEGLTVPSFSMNLDQTLLNIIINDFDIINSICFIHMVVGITTSLSFVHQTKVKTKINRRSNTMLYFVFV